MNPDQPSREQIEARITALLLGELPADEAALLRYTIAQEPALKKLYDELQSALPLIREAAKHPAEAPAEKPAPLKLSADRREKLLAHFKTPPPKVEREPLFWLRRIEVRTLVKVLSVVAILGLIAALAVPALKSTKKTRGQYEGVHGIFSFGEWFAEEFPANTAEQARMTALSASAAPTSSAPPTVVALASEPQPTPPPAAPPTTQIVLPQPESTPEVAAQSGAPANTSHGGVYSQSIVGYVNIPISSNTVPVPMPETAPAAAAPPQAPVQEAKELYERGEFDAAKAGLNEAIASDPNNTTATYYLNLIKQKELASNMAWHNTDTQERMEHVEKQWIVPSSATNSFSSFDGSTNGNNQNAGVANTFAGNTGGGFGGFGGFGGGGFGGSPATGGVGHGTDGQYGLNQALVARSQNQKAAGETDQFGPAPAGNAPGQAPNTATLAFDDDGANRNKDLPATARQTFQWSLGPGAASTPPTQLPRLALNESASEDKKTTAGNSDQFFTSGLRDREINGTVGQDFSRFPTGGKEGENSTPASLSQSAASLASAAPPPPPSVAPATPLAANNVDFDAGAIPAENGTTTFSGSTAVKGGYSLTHHNLQQGHPPDSPAPVAVNSDHGLHVGGVISGAATVSLQTDLAKEDGEGLRYLATNSPQPSSTPKIPNPFVTRYAYAVPTAGALDQPQSSNLVALNGGANNTFNPGVSAIQPAPQEMPRQLYAEHFPSTTPSPTQQEETIAPGLIDFEGADLSQVLDIYAKLANRTLLQSSLPQGQIILKTQTSLTKTEAIEALQSVLALNGVSLINVGDKFVKVVPSAQAGTMGGDIDRSGSTNAPTPGSYITQVVQLRYVKPTDMMPLIQPFARLTNSILPIDNNGILVLRDNAQNVGRMLKMIEQVDVSGPVEYISEVIPIRYAKVDDIASAISELGSKEIQLSGQTKIIPSENNSSLLIYATRTDMDVIKGAIAKLDTKSQSELPLRKPTPSTPLPQPEILTSNNAFSTFSLNVSDVSFKFAEASLQNGKLPDTASIRSEEFINAFDYRDPEAAAGQPMAFTSERARYSFAQNRDLLRFSIKTAAAGRQAGRPLNLVLLLDTSGSMERADRVAIIHEALRVLATQLHENDIVSVVSFARTARLWADGISGDKAGETLDKVGAITPEGGTNLEEAMRLAYETARRHYLASGMNRVVLLTDGAANLGKVDPSALKDKVEAQRKQGIALDCFGIGWEDYNDDLLEELSSNGDGRYAFLNSPEDASRDFAAKLAGALQVAAEDVKVQVEFNPQRVTAYRQIGYATHQLTKQQFRDNTVAAAPIAAQEAGNALYTIETNPNGDGPIATVHVRYRIPGTQDYHEHSWDVAYTGNAPALENSSPAMRLAATASAFSEWLAASPYAQEVTPDELLKDLSGVPQIYGADDRPKQLETMIREAKSLEGK